MEQYEFDSLEIAAVFKSFPDDMRKRLLALRALILETAENTEGVGKIQETLKWGVPSYLTSESKSGTTIRLAPTRSDRRYGLYVHCQTSLIKEFSQKKPDVFCYEGTRALILNTDVEPSRPELVEFITAALTYHSRKKRNGSS